MPGFKVYTISCLLKFSTPRNTAPFTSTVVLTWQDGLVSVLGGMPRDIQVFRVDKV